MSMSLFKPAINICLYSTMFVTQRLKYIHVDTVSLRYKVCFNTTNLKITTFVNGVW